jgi:hypothetical protein
VTKWLHAIDKFQQLGIPFGGKLKVGTLVAIGLNH